VQDLATRNAELEQRLAQQREEIAQQREEIAQLKALVVELREELNRHSGNSSKPPSSDSPSQREKNREKRKRRSAKKRRRGGQPGHKGRCRKLLPEDEVDAFVHHYPDECENCWQLLPKVPDADAMRFVCQRRVRSLSQADKASVVREALAPIGAHDPVPRPFELVSCQFDVVLSAACYGQLKRHRMSTQVVQPYDPGLGFTVPPSVLQVGMERELRHVVAASTRLYERIAPHAPAVAAYALTQAHRRRVLVQMNARELYHFARLRQDEHAQWDIRGLADRMLNLARKELPLTLMLACGKDRFDEQRREVTQGGSRRLTPGPLPSPGAIPDGVWRCRSGLEITRVFLRPRS
jgi:thymidylate synthase ThyX/uncharacterized coiled-coil protein SlyX